MLGGASAALAFMFAMFAKMAVEAPPDRGGEDVALFCAALAVAFVAVAVWKYWKNGMPGVASAALAFMFAMFAKMAVEVAPDRGGDGVALFCAALAVAFATVAVWKCWRMTRAERSPFDLVWERNERRLVGGIRPRMHYLRMGKSPVSKEGNWSVPWSEPWFEKGMRDVTYGDINAIEKNRRTLRDQVDKAKSGHHIRIAATERSSYEAGIRLGARLGYDWRKLDDVLTVAHQGFAVGYSTFTSEMMVREMAREEMMAMMAREKMRTVVGSHPRSRYLRMDKSPTSEEENWSEPWFKNGMRDATYGCLNINAIKKNRRKLRDQVDEAKSGRHIRIAAAERSSYEAGMRLGLRGLRLGYNWRKLGDVSIAISRGEGARRLGRMSFRSKKASKGVREILGAALYAVLVFASAIVGASHAMTGGEMAMVKASAVVTFVFAVMAVGKGWIWASARKMSRLGAKQEATGRRGASEKALSSDARE